MLGHKKNLSKFKKIEIKSSLFSDHNNKKLEINCMNKTGKIQTSGDWKHTTQKPLGQ